MKLIVKRVFMVICSLFMLQVADAGNNNVTMKKVKFNNKGIEMAGHLFLPEKMESGKTYPSSYVQVLQVLSRNSQVGYMPGN